MLAVLTLGLLLFEFVLVLAGGPLSWPISIALRAVASLGTLGFLAGLAYTRGRRAGLAVWLALQPLLVLLLPLLARGPDLIQFAGALLAAASPVLYLALRVDGDAQLPFLAASLVHAGAILVLYLPASVRAYVASRGASRGPDAAIDGRILGAGVAAAVAAGLVVFQPPLLRSLDGLAALTRGSAVALAVVTLVGALVLVRTFRSSRA